MTTNQQIVKMKCPHCGWVRRMKLDVEAGQADVVRGQGEALRDTLRKIQGMLANPKLEEAEAWLPVPKCPNCGQGYEYNIITGKTR